MPSDARDFNCFLLHDSGELLTADSKGIRTWDPRSGTKHLDVRRPGWADVVDCGPYLMIQHQNGGEIIDASNGHRVLEHMDGIVAVSPDHREVLRLQGQDVQIVGLDGTTLGSLHGLHKVDDARFSDDGRLIATTGPWPYVVDVWDAQRRELLRTYPKASSFEFSPDDRQVLIYDDKGCYLEPVGSSDKGSVDFEGTLDFHGFDSAKFTPDNGSVLVSHNGVIDSEHWLFRCSTGRMLANFKAREASLSEDGRFVILQTMPVSADLPGMYGDSRVAVLDSHSGRPVTFPWIEGAFGAWRSDRGLLVVARPDGLRRYRLLAPDPDAPPEVIRLISELWTNQTITASGEQKRLSPDEWRTRATRYRKLAAQHSAVCQFPHANLWKTTDFWKN